MVIDLRRFRPLLVLVALAFPALSFFLIHKGNESKAAAGGASARASPSIPASVEDPTAVTPRQTLFRESNLQRALVALRGRLRPGQRLLRLEVRPHVVEFHLREGDGASGFSWLAKERHLRPIQVRIIGNGPLDEEEFSLEHVRPGAPRRIEARVRDEAGDLRATAMALERVAPDAYLQWNIAAQAAGRHEIYATDPTGRGLLPIETFIRRRQGG